MSSTASPAGCYLMHHTNATSTAYYNSLAAGAECGGGRLAGAGVETRCQQEFSDHKLVTLGESGEELVVDTFSFPSCCTCLIGSDLLL